MSLSGIKTVPSLLIKAEGTQFKFLSLLQQASVCAAMGEFGNKESVLWEKKNRLLICDYLRLFLFNHGFISCSVSLLLYFSFWQVDQEAVAKSFIVCGILATLGSMAMRESSLATLVTFYPGCSSLKSHSCWLPCTPPSGFILRMSQ